MIGSIHCLDPDQMLDQFPPFPTMFGVDFVIIAITAIATFLIVRKRDALRASNAFTGAILALAGLWVLTAIFLADLASMTVLVGVLGQSRAMSFMLDLHTLYTWYANTAGVALIAIGVVMMMTQTLRETELQSAFRKQMEQKQTNLDQAAQLASVGFYVYDPVKEEIEYCSETHAQNHGLSLEDYMKSFSTLSNDMPLIHPEDKSAVRSGYERAQEGETVRLAYRVPTKDGIRELREIVKPIFDDDQKIIREIGTNIDVTDHIMTEKQLFLAQKNEAIGQLTGGVAHDFNNVLAAIMGNIELLEEELRANGVDEAHWKESTTAGLVASKRGAELVQNLLSFARKADLAPQTTNWNDLISETDSWLRRTLRSSIRTEVSLHAGLWSTSIDQVAGQSAFVNLVLNAQNAMPDGGKLTIETSNVHVSDEYIEDRNEDISPGRYVMIAVSDTGIGIAPENIDRVFDPFFSTQSPANGSGLGLSMVQGFMRQSNGAVRVYSEVGVGTTFKLYFPATEAKIPPASDVNKPRKRASDAIRILMAEDDKSVLKVLYEVLVREGHDVVAAASGDEALAMFKEDSDFDLLLTDIVMPGRLQGPALAKGIREIAPSMPVIFMSGYPHEATVHGNGLRPEDIRLMKPVGKEKLMDAIQKAVAGKVVI